MKTLTIVSTPQAGNGLFSCGEGKVPALVTMFQPLKREMASLAAKAEGAV